MPQYKSLYSSQQIDDALSDFDSYGQLAGLYGANTDQKKQIIRDSKIIDTGRLAGTALGGTLGYLFGSEIGAITPNHSYTPNALNVGLGIGGALLGNALGNYLTFKGMSKHRGTDDRFSLRHFRKPAQLAALQGMGKNVQNEWNEHGLTIDMAETLGPEVTRKLRDASILDQLLSAKEHQKRFYAPDA